MNFYLARCAHGLEFQTVQAFLRRRPCGLLHAGDDFGASMGAGGYHNIESPAVITLALGYMSEMVLSRPCIS